MAALASYIASRALDRPTVETFARASVSPPEPAPLCPWREPESDMRLFFPQATAHRAELRILSGLRSELSQQLHRQPTGDENALRLNRIFEGENSLGAIVTRRVKGENGGIELVLAIDNEGAVRGLRLQRLREPDVAAQALQNTNWLASFAGKHAQDPWKLGEDVASVGANGQRSAEAIVDAVRSLLVLNEASVRARSASLAEAHHH